MQIYANAFMQIHPPTWSYSFHFCVTLLHALLSLAKSHFHTSNKQCIFFIAFGGGATEYTGLYEIKYCAWNNVVCCVGFTSASSVQLHGNYSQWHWHYSGSDRPSHATCGCAGNTEPVTVNNWVSMLVNSVCLLMSVFLTQVLLQIVITSCILTSEHH